jgi:hypothetical protein
MRRRLVLALLAGLVVSFAAGALAKGGDADKGPKERSGDERDPEAADWEEVERDGDGRDDPGHEDDRDEDGDGDGRHRQAPVALTGDAAVRQSVRSDPGRLTYVFLVGGLGPLVAKNVRLATTLPDVASDWSLEGLGADSCRLSGLELDCAFGDLAPGEIRLIQASGSIDVVPAWELRTTAQLGGHDGHADNDAATTILGVLLM